MKTKTIQNNPEIIELYEKCGWKVYGYSEYNSVGIPKFAEIRKEEEDDNKESL